MNENTRAEISRLTTPLTLAVLACAPNFETRAYLELKKQKAKDLGVVISISTLPLGTTTAEMTSAVAEACVTNDGVIVQLPLPDPIDTDAVLVQLPKTHDVDNFNYKGEEGAVLPPVVGAVMHISKEYNISWAGKKVVAVGAGRLVGAPIGFFARTMGGIVSTLTVEATREELKQETLSADIIVLGTGVPGLLSQDMVKEGVVIFDAGASEAGGVLVGDADPGVANKALYLTPVPGGIGPLTIAILFRNLLELRTRQ